MHETIKQGVIKEIMKKFNKQRKFIKFIPLQQQRTQEKTKIRRYTDKMEQFLTNNDQRIIEL